MNKAFSLQSKDFFLTFPKSKTLTNKSIVQFQMQQLFASKKANIVLLMTAYEVSDDPKPYKHFHVLLKMDRRLKIDNPHYFDVGGTHGDYQSLKNVKDSMSYIKKDASYLTYDPTLLSVEASSVTPSKLVTHLYKQIMNTYTDKRYKKLQDLTLQQLISHYVKKLCIRVQTEYSLANSKIQKGLIDMLTRNAPYILERQDRSIKYDIKEYNVPKPVTLWKKMERTTKVLILTGNSGLGKTSMLKALIKPLIVKNLNQLGTYNGLDLDNGLLLDDPMLQKYSTEELIALFDLEQNSAINIKYSTLGLPAGRPLMITTNNLQKNLPSAFDHNGDLHPSLKRRCVIYNVTVSLLVKVDLYPI